MFKNRSPPLIIFNIYISGLSEYILLRLSIKSLTATSDERTIITFVPRIKEYTGLA